MSVIIGIDFGTCFSSVYFLHGDQCMPLSPEGEQSMIPTVFYHDEKKGNLAGKAALRAGKNKPAGLLEYIKRRYKEQEFRFGTDVLRTEEIISHMIGYLMQGARNVLRTQYHLDDSDLSAVLTIPVTYGEEWKKMLINALKNADVKVHAVIQEPVAAAVCFLETNQTSEDTVLVYDLGGGTTDVTLLKRTGTEQQPYAVLAQEGDVIGGNDWDEHLLTLIEQQLDAQLTEMPEEEKEHFFVKNHRRLAALAREIKEFLSEEQVYDIPCEIRGTLYDIRITREEFEACTSSLLNRTIQTIRKVIKNQKAFHEVILVGGGSHMPQVKTRIQKEFPDCHVRISTPEFAVAMGAARYAVMSAPVPVLLKSSHSYGIIFEEGQNRKVRNLIFKNAVLPASGRYEWELSGQFLQFAVSEGDYLTEETAVLQQARYALSVVIWFSRPPAADTKCITELELDSSGLLKMTVSDQNGNEISGASVSIS